MPELHYTDDELGLAPGWDENSDGTRLDPNIRREIRQGQIARQELEKERAERQAERRELLLYKAGVPADAKGQFFAKGYDGPDDAESIKTAYQALFGEQSGSAGGEQEGGDADLDAQRRIAAAAGGSQQSAGEPDELLARMRAARTNKQEARDLIASLPPELGIRLKDQIDAG